MKSKVYFIKVVQTDEVPRVQAKLARLLRESKVLDWISEKDIAVIKMHFGEERNVGHVLPEYVKVISDWVSNKKAIPILSDTNTLYRGRRTNSKDHSLLACEHGFAPVRTGARVVIPDDTKKENCAEVPINQKFIKVAKIVKLFLEADALIDVAHFKGHLMTGFGGVLKNIGMGCATREGKLAQHSDISPVVDGENCIGCGACEAVCPVSAISLNKNNGKANVDGKLCIGCASCIAACDYQAMVVNWAAGGDTIQEKMIEYTKAVLDSRKGKTAYINFAIKITKECDCLAKDDPRISPDIGIFASLDPVSLDSACRDAVIAECGRDIFKELHPERDGNKQLQYAAKLGLGNLEYELIEVK